MKAVWKDTTLAESADTIVIEGNHYFPTSSIKQHFFLPSNTKTQCGWKGEASYYTIVVDGEENTDAAWFYPSPKDAAKEITGYVVFWKGVEVVDS